MDASAYAKEVVTAAKVASRSVAKARTERKNAVLRAAYAYEQATPWHTMWPEL